MQHCFCEPGWVLARLVGMDLPDGGSWYLETIATRRRAHYPRIARDVPPARTSDRLHGIGQPRRRRPRPAAIPTCPSCKSWSHSVPCDARWSAPAMPVKLSETWELLLASGGLVSCVAAAGARVPLCRRTVRYRVLTASLRADWRRLTAAVP